MAILGLQGIRGGVGTTSIAAALGWSLQVLGESVLVIDACPDNLLRMSFNVDYGVSDGWARALLDGRDWRDTAQRYTSQLDILPFGQLTVSEMESLHTRFGTLGYFADALQLLQEKATTSGFCWICQTAFLR